MAPLEPIDDDQKVRNDVTVQREGGASGHAVLEVGALSTQPPPDGVVVYDESLTLNLYSDDQAERHAYWRMHLGTWDEARYPVVDLAAAPGLINQVTALESGDRIQIANPPAWLPPGPIDLLMQGYQEVIGHPNDWDFQFNCTPAGSWAVAESAVIEDFEDTAYEVTITDGGNLPWTRSQVHYNTGSWSLRSGAITGNQIVRGRAAGAGPVHGGHGHGPRAAGGRHQAAGACGDDRPARRPGWCEARHHAKPIPRIGKVGFHRDSSVDTPAFRRGRNRTPAEQGRESRFAARADRRPPPTTRRRLVVCRPSGQR
ncbi:hypothetical protein [Streptomyces mirabilis]|uniref:hypothetical protein n=1 Tax=Streptomyces mirabilis TaxID=68239 RepID=UPI002F90C055